ncbi:unnamed protein product [Fusarium venenatum]|uniref:Uncharacterized protein n=1 Tax=Fusarium venenatum TaxID=56646 RepID=A0A2L2SZY4_9HYPO|nr:uncharacterized protein FVRRES_00264 [Fusarium venenatum]CEI63752.1 unnamed protein product [Fusarium venenatum]
MASVKTYGDRNSRPEECDERSNGSLLSHGNSDSEVVLELDDKKEITDKKDEQHADTPKGEELEMRGRRVPR